MKTNPFGGHNITPKQEPVYYINTRGRYNYSNNPNTQKARGQQRNANINSQKQCYKCGNQYVQNHFLSCPAQDKICSKCAKRGHFAKVCRSTHVSYLEDRRSTGGTGDGKSRNRKRPSGIG